MINLKVKNSVSDGVAIAKAYVIEDININASTDLIEESNISVEMEIFEKVLQKTKDEIALLAKNSEIFAAHLEVADDPSLYDGIKDKICDELKNTQLALEETTNEICQLFMSLDDKYLQERAADIKDVSKRIMCNLKGLKLNVFESISQEVIVVADDITPSDTANMNFDFVKGFISAKGGSTSHVSIIAKQLELPAMVGVSDILLDVKNDDVIILDSVDDLIIINPTDEVIEEYKAKKVKLLEEREKYQKVKYEKAITLDGSEVEIFCNVGNVSDIEKGVENGAQGVGLFRTELLYMESTHFPTLEEQFEVYKDAVEKCKGTVIVRTLDIGGDKALSYFKFDNEENPFLGWRAIRICLELKDIFKTQLKALLMASAYGNIQIMYPMIISLEELRDANKLLEECKKELRISNIPYNKDIEVGIMIETPASVMIAEQLAQEVDFFSIGTNDLTQYILAVDRGNLRIANLYNSFHPAVLRAIKYVIEAAHKYGKVVGMCGEFASDDKALPILIGLGLDEFSMASSSIAKVKYRIKQMEYSKLQEYANEVCKKSTIQEVLQTPLF